MVWPSAIFSATVSKTVRRMLSVCCLSVCLSCPVCLSVCDVRALRPNGSTDQDETWHACRPRPWPHCVRWGRGPSSPSPKGAQPPQFSAHICFGPMAAACMDQDVTWYGARPRPRRLCVRWQGFFSVQFYTKVQF